MLSTREHDSFASFLPVVILTLSAWALTLTADIVLYWVVPGYKEVFNNYEVELPQFSMLMLDLSTMPLYIPIMIAITATIAAILGLAIGWTHQRLMIILALLVNILALAMLIIMYVSLRMPIQEIAASGA